MNNKSFLLKFASLLLCFIAITISCTKEPVEVDKNFPEGKVFSITSDPGGTIWVGTESGLLSIRNGSWKRHSNYTGAPSGDIYEIANSLKGGEGNELWLASDAGLVNLSYSDDTPNKFVTFTTEKGGLPDNKVLALTIDHSGGKWIGTRSGLSYFKDSTQLTIDEFGDLILHQITSIDSDEEGWIFAGTRGMGVGRFQLNENLDAITAASYYESDWSGIRSDTILSVLVISHDEQWYGTPEGLAHHTSWKAKEKWRFYTDKEGLAGKRVQSITLSEDGALWIGTNKGASSFINDSWQSYTVADGLISESVNDIAIGKNGITWFATEKGVSSFDGKTWVNYLKP